MPRTLRVRGILLGILLGMASAPLPGMKSIDKMVGHVGSASGLYPDAKPLIYAFALALFAFLIISPTQTYHNFALTFFLAPLWMPFILGEFAMMRFIQSRRMQGLAKQKYVLLELRLPRDTQKSVLAMETFFANMNFGSGESNWYKRIINGGLRPWWSFEIASLGGQVHFYVWTRDSLRRGVESYLYSQYPDMEIIEAEDYSRIVDPTSDDYSMFGEEFVKSKTDMDPMPIKTYLSYKLDQAGAKPEEQVDPLAQVIELLGSLGPKEQMWIQFIVRQTKKEKYNNEKDWQARGLEIIDEIRKATVRKSTYTDPLTGKVIETEGFPNPTKGQLEGIAAIENNTNKPGFDTGIRIIYTAPKDAYMGSMASFLLNIFKPFANEAGNGFKPIAMFSAGFGDYPWEDRSGAIHRWVEERIVKYYRHRAYFADPYVGPWSIFSSEELATLYHIPSGSVATPSLPRIQSATTGAPANLPT